jgi:acyl-CoA dehydrogenase
MNFEYSDKTKRLQAAIAEFMEANVYPNEERIIQQIDDGDRWQPVPLIEELKAKAKAQGCGTSSSRKANAAPV